VTRLSHNPPVFSLHGKHLEEECSKNDAESKAMGRLSLAAAHQKSGNSGSWPKILCAVYGMNQKAEHIRAVRETWGTKCDGFVVAATKTDPSIDAVHIPQLYDEDAYHNMWQKVRFMWSYIYDNYYNEYDWFHVGGDDMWVIVENLREYLGIEEIRTAANGGLYLPRDNDDDDDPKKNKTQKPLYLGSRWKHPTKVIYNTGGPGTSCRRYPRGPAFVALPFLLIERNIIPCLTVYTLNKAAPRYW
jgi:hypothetical protein